MTRAFHPLLLRQLRRSAGVASADELLTRWGAGDGATGNAAVLEALLCMVSDSYTQFDRDLALRARSMVLSSEELTQANERLREEAASQQRVLDLLRQSANALLPAAPDGVRSSPLSDLQALAAQLRESLSQRLLAERKLADSEHQFRSLVANLPGCVYRRLNDAAPTMLFLSDAVEQAIGWGAEEFTSGRRSLARQVHPEDRQELVRTVTAAVNARQRFSVHYRYRHADGSQRWANERGQGVYDTDGQLLYIDGVLFDRTENVMARQEADRTRQQLLDAISALDVGVLMLDSNDEVVICNAKFRQYYEPMAEVLRPGVHIVDIFRASGRIEQIRGGQNLDETQWLERRMAQHRALDHGPNTGTFELNGRWLQWDDSRTRQGITLRIVTDITETKQMMLNLARARDVAEAASLAKTRFLANMSHELRTPLNAVIGAAQLMKSGEQDDSQREHLLEAIERSGANLLGLIENILDLSRIEAGELQLVPEDFHLVECVEAALATAGLSARAKGLELACIIEPGLQFWRHGDPARLRQVLLNLLGNAVKFTFKGEIVVRVEAGPRPDDLLISVSDTGVGIPSGSLAHVFLPFRQADDGADRRFGGSGLGLAIVKQLVDAMGGRVRVDSTQGVGTRFELALALPGAANPPADSMRAPEVGVGLPVAFFEPHEASAEALEKLLRRMGCEPHRCRDAQAVRAWCTSQTGVSERPWLLVCTDAPLASAVLEQVAEVADPERVIAMSRVESHEADLGRARLRLPRSVIKPVSRAALVSRFVDTSIRPLRQAVDKPLPSNPVDPCPTRILVVEDDMLNQAIVCQMLHRAGYKVSTASDGKSALEAVQRERCDLVLMDWQMPDMDGLEATRRLRAGEAGPPGHRIPIIALTANAFAEDRQACMDAGMNDFLTKPILAASLMEAIERWAPARPPVFDPSVLAAMPMVADGSQPDFVSELLELYTEGARRNLATLRQSADDPSTVRRAMHTLKSSSASVGAMELAAIAARAEASLRSGQAVSPDLADELGGALEKFLLHLASRKTPCQS